MDKWFGEWEFVNAHLRQDGRRGVMKVEAPSVEKAREKNKEEASIIVFFTTIMP